MALNLVLKSAEVKLVETLNAINEPGNWRSVHFHLDKLLEQYKSDYQVKIAINLIYDLLKTYEGSVFLLVDNSIVVLCHHLEKTLLNKLIFQLRYLYMDDPLAYTEDGQENADFCDSYDLARDAQTLLDLSTRRMAVSLRKGQAGEKEIPKAALRGLAEDQKTGNPVVHGMQQVMPHNMSASGMAGIEQDLSRADLSRVIRRQPVCASLPGVQVRRVFDELYIHIAHLRQMLSTDVDVLSNRWLFKYLTQLLDDRMIELIRQHPDRYLGSPVSLNLNVETLLSSHFAEFDAIVKPSFKVSMVIEVPVIDVFADMTAFIYARKEAQKLGYRICLDGLTSRSFLNINRDKLGVDLIKVQWNAATEGDLQTKENRDLAAAVQAAGSNRVILCRCDNLQAVQFGQAMGISLFQGRYLDSLINPTAQVEN